MGWNCIAAWEKGVLQYCLLAGNCIAIQLCQAGLRRQGLYRNTVQSIVTEAAGLCHDTAVQGHDTAGGERRQGAGALGERAGTSGS